MANPWSQIVLINILARLVIAIVIIALTVAVVVGICSIIPVPLSGYEKLILIVVVD